MRHPFPWRSLVFAPANRHALLSKFGRFAADNYVIDLEDGTPWEHKETAREQLHDAVAAALGDGLRGRLFVRINALSSPLGAADLKKALSCDIDGLVIPKLERPAELEQVDRAMAESGRALDIVGGIESIEGVLDIRLCLKASSHLRAVYFGAEDFATEMGARRTEAGTEILYARQRVVLAARSAGIAAIDQAVTNIYDDAIFERDATQGRDFGYDGKICLNPRQAGLANALFSADPTEIAYAQRLLDAVAVATAAGQGAISFEGRMIDAPLIKRAQQIVLMADCLRDDGA